jgi:hypothetical protein
MINVHYSGSIVWDMLETKSGSAGTFYGDLEKLDLPQGHHGLVATAEYINSRFQFLGTLVVTNGTCLLNDKPTSARRVRLANGSGAIVVTNGTNDLTLSPNGDWTFSEGGDSGKQFTGGDADLEKVYLAIRQGAK